MASELYDAEYTIFTGSGALWGRNIIILYVYVRRNAMDSLPSSKSLHNSSTEH